MKLVRDVKGLRLFLVAGRRRQKLTNLLLFGLVIVGFVLVLLIDSYIMAQSFGWAKPLMGLGDEVVRDADINPTPLLQRYRAGYEYFDWADWLDFSDCKKYDYGSLEPELYPYVSLHDLKHLQFPYRKKTTSEEQAMIGRLYCRSFLSAPQRIIAVYDAPAGSVPTHEVFSVRHRYAQRSHLQFGQTRPRKAKPLGPPLIPALQSAANRSTLLQIPIDYDMFVWNARKAMTPPPQASDDEVEYAAAVELALSKVLSAQKYFYEVLVLNDLRTSGSHYDWRFFREFIDFEHHIAAIHNMQRAWSRFADSMGIAYWIAHGSLLGWYWNGMMLPWDSDNDIQMPIMELDRLAREFNGTLVVDAGNEGSKGKYLIDVSPWYVQRTKGNGRNRIDARFIDITTGLYIDITGLARTNRRPQVNCKDWHYYRPEDLLPIRRISYEGLPSYAPKNVTGILKSEYPKFLNEDYKNWSYNHRARLWEYESTCKKQFGNHPYASVVCPDDRVLPPDLCDVSALGTCKVRTLTLYERTRNITAANARFKMLSAKQDAGGKFDEKLREIVTQRLLRVYG